MRILLGNWEIRLYKNPIHLLFYHSHSTIQYFIHTFIQNKYYHIKCNNVFILFLLLALIMVHTLHTAAVEPPTAEDDSVNDLLVRNAKGGIDLACTAKCFEWWKCRISCLFFCKCDKPSGCDCSQFAWE